MSAQVSKKFDSHDIAVAAKVSLTSSVVYEVSEYQNVNTTSARVVVSLKKIYLRVFFDSYFFGLFCR